MKNVPLHLSYYGEWGLANDSDIVPYKDKFLRCRKKGCGTILNGYRIAKGSIYCSAHEKDEFIKANKKDFGL